MFQDDLSDKLSEIRRRALDEYDRWLRQNVMQVETDDGAIGLHSFELNESRTELVVPEHLSRDTVAQYTNHFEGFLSEIDRLEQRFERYFELAAGSLDDLRDLLSPFDETALGEMAGQWGQPGPTPSTSSVVGKINHATSSVVLPLADPEDMRAEPVWDGAAARAFNEDFLLPFSEYSARQAFCAIYLANVVQYARNTTRGTQDDLLAIADECIAALQGEGHGGTPISALKAASLIADVVSMALPFPAGIIVGVGAIALDVASEFHRLPEPPEWGISTGAMSGMHWHWDAIYGAHDLLTTLEQRLADLDDELSTAMSEDAQNSFYSPSFRLRSERPDPPDAIVPTVEAPANPTDDMFVANIETVYEFGRVKFPEAADEFRSAADKLDRCEMPQWLNVILSRTSGNFALMRSCLLPALQGTESHLSYAGEQLVAICDEYEWAEAENAASFERFKDAVEEDATSPTYRYPVSLAQERMAGS